MREHTTDDNCMGHCRCPECDGPAHWSFHAKRHACADPECRTIFKEHNHVPQHSHLDVGSDIPGGGAA